MIKAAIFDIDGTLIDSFEANLKFFQDLMTAIGHRPPTREEFGSMFHFTLRGLVEKLTGITDEAELARISEIGAKREVPYDASLVSLMEGVEETIPALRATHALGIVTSRNRVGVYEIPALAALKHHFDVAVAYEDTTEHKPHPAPLLLAAEKLGVAPHECVYVGDVANDAKAARAAGMKAIVYAKGEIPGADHVTPDFREILTLIKELS